MEENEDSAKKDDFASRLRNLRRLAGMSQPDLSVAAGVPLPTIRNLEQRKREPTWETLVKLNRALGSSLGDWDGTAVSSDEPDE